MKAETTAPPEQAPAAALEEVTFNAASSDMAALRAYAQRVKMKPAELLQQFTREWAAMARRIYKV